MLWLVQFMEVDLQNYSPTACFVGHPVPLKTFRRNMDALYHWILKRGGKKFKNIYNIIKWLFRIKKKSYLRRYLWILNGTVLNAMFRKQAYY